MIYIKCIRCILYITETCIPYSSPSNSKLTAKANCLSV